MIASFHGMSGKLPRLFNHNIAWISMTFREKNGPEHPALRIATSVTAQGRKREKLKKSRNYVTFLP
jgi:hypothetical protein